MRDVEEKKVNQKIEAKEEIPGRVLFAHDTSSAESRDESSLL